MNTGGQAFPSVVGGGGKDHGGMSLRDYFAGQALPKVMDYYMTDSEGDMQLDPSFDIHDDAANIAEDAYAIADAMLAAREVK